MLAELGSVFASVCGFLYIEYKTFAIDILGSLIITVLTLAAIILLNYRYCMAEVTSYIGGTVLNNIQAYHDSSIRFANYQGFLRQIENFLDQLLIRQLMTFQSFLPFLWLETFQAIIIMLKSKEKQRANEGTFCPLYIWEII
jgi:hypothetical protein